MALKKNGMTVSDIFIALSAFDGCVCSVIPVLRLSSRKVQTIIELHYLVTISQGFAGWLTDTLRHARNITDDICVWGTAELMNYRPLINNSVENGNFHCKCLESTISMSFVGSGGNWS